jgi:hypothetical protein
MQSDAEENIVETGLPGEVVENMKLSEVSPLAEPPLLTCQ